MSMNLHLRAKREIAVNISGKTSLQFIEPQTITFELYQTPTRVTYAIMASDNPIQAYKDFVISKFWHEYEEPVYAEDDIWEEGKPIGTRTVCHADEHIREFDTFIAKCQNEGYTLEFYDM